MDLFDNTPKHIQIADSIRKQILAGQIDRGAKLLSAKELAMQYRVNYHTVSAGLKLLVEEKLIERSPRRGTIVIADVRKEQKSNIVGAVSFSSGDVYSKMFKVIVERLLEGKLCPLVISSDAMASTQSLEQREQKVKDYLECMYWPEQKPFGFLVDGFLQFPYAFLEQLPDVNAVFMIKYHYPSRIKSGKYALTDFQQAGRSAARHFIQRGFKKLACLAVHELDYQGEWSSMQVMIQRGFAEECHLNKINYDENVFWKLLHGAPFENTVTEYLADKANRPEGIFMYSDSQIMQLLLPIMERLHLYNHRDIDVIGFYNTNFSQQYNFSSIDIQEEKIANTAIDLLLNKVPGNEIIIPTKLIVRM